MRRVSPWSVVISFLTQVDLRIISQMNWWNQWKSFDLDLLFRIKEDEVSFMGHYSQSPSTQISAWQSS